MNRKKTNLLVVILNIIAIIALYILQFSQNYIMSNSIMSGNTEGLQSIYSSPIIDFLVNNMPIIIASVYAVLGILNIICAIQNKENKKICFWQLVFGIFCIWSYTIPNILVNNYNITEWGDTILFGIIPIIVALINLILIKRNKPKVIQILSYIAVILFAILQIIGIISTIYWGIIALIMQLIYICFQDKNIVENEKRKFTNIILYYTLQLILVISFFLIIIASIIITAVNNNRFENEQSKLYNSIITLQGNTNERIYIPVEKNYKYGFINENGKEEIPCTYDRVSYFNEISINNNKYYIALAKKDDKYYILSKDNKAIAIEGYLEDYLKDVYEYYDKEMIQQFNSEVDYRSIYIQSFEFIIQTLTKNTEINPQILKTIEPNHEINLNEKDSKYYGNNQNYAIIIEPVYGEEDEEDYDEEDFLLGYIQCNVTIKKSNGETESSIVYLPGLDLEEKNLTTFTNGYIEFKNEDNTQMGWYDNNGNKVTIPNSYTIKDIKENKIILQFNNYSINSTAELNFSIIDTTGKELIRTTALSMYDKMYLIKNENNKMILIDKDLKTISNEYDKIIANMQIDEDYKFSSYYKF